jgi:hypothetical protein
MNRSCHSAEAELDELLDRAVRVDNDPLGGLEHVGPDRQRAGTARKDVVRGEDEGPLVGESAEPAQVQLRPRQPLDVHHVGVEALDPPQQAGDARRVLEALRCQAKG